MNKAEKRRPGRPPSGKLKTLYTTSLSVDLVKEIRKEKNQSEFVEKALFDVIFGAKKTEKIQ